MPTDEFTRDVAHYHVPAATVERIRRALADDQRRGVDDPERRDVKLWEVGGFRVSYMFFVFSPSDALIVLQRIQPVEEPPARLGAKALELIEIVNRVKRLLSGWGGGGNGNG